MRNEKACLTVAHGFTNARRVRRDDGCPAGRRLEIGDSPSFLRRREHERPGPAKKRQLLRLVDTSKKPYARAKVKRSGELFQRGAVVAGARDLERRRRVVQRREGADDEVQRLVLLQPAEIGERRRRGARVVPRRVRNSVDTRVDHLDRLARNASLGKIGRGAHADRLEWDALVGTAERALGKPDRGGNRRGELLKGRRAEQVRYKSDDRRTAPPRRVERHLVHILDEQIELRAGEFALKVLARQEGKGVARADANHVDAV